MYSFLIEETGLHPTLQIGYNLIFILDLIAGNYFIWSINLQKILISWYMKHYGSEIVTSSRFPAEFCDIWCL